MAVSKAGIGGIKRTSSFPVINWIQINCFQINSAKITIITKVRIYSLIPFAIDSSYNEIFVLIHVNSQFCVIYTLDQDGDR